MSYLILCAQKYKSWKNGFDHSPAAIAKIADDAAARRSAFEHDYRRAGLASSGKVLLRSEENGKESEIQGAASTNSHNGGKASRYGKAPGSGFRMTPVPIPGVFGRFVSASGNTSSFFQVALHQLYQKHIPAKYLTTYKRCGRPEVVGEETPTAAFSTHIYI